MLAVSVDPKGDTARAALVDLAGKQRLLYDLQVTARQVLHDLRLLMKRRA